MVSLWGSKKNGQNDDNDSSESTTTPTRRDDRSQPTERTRLLDNNPPPRGAYLDPDDPAVSPFNLWSVKIVRYLTVLLAMITFIWWVLLLVSIFVTPPGLGTRGSGYTDFSYACLALGTLLMTLIFFVTPSKATGILLGVVSFLLLADMIIILVIPRIREEEGGPGIASCVWALFIALWAVMTERLVAWGKREEEERLTGRAENRRTFSQWVGVFIATIISAIYIVILVLLTGTLVIRALDAGLQPEGERYEVDLHKYKVHLNCIGNKTSDPTARAQQPTVLLESAEVPLEYDFDHWMYNAWENGTIPRYCYWDRPGYAFSDDAPSPHSAGMSADSLYHALAAAGEEGPWVSVSAGYGSVVARIFAARHASEVVGLMLIDPLHEDLLYRMASISRGFLLWAYGVLSPLGVERLGGAIFKGRTKEDRVYGENVWSTGKFLKAKLQESLVAETLSKNEVSTLRNIMNKKTPLVVVSSGIAVAEDSDWYEKQKDLSKLTKRLISWDIVNKAPHEVWKTLQGRDILEKRLGELYRNVTKSPEP